MERYEINKYLDSFKKRLDDIEKSLNVTALDAEMKALDQKMREPNFWDDQNSAQQIISRLNAIRENVDAFEKYQNELADVEVLVELMDDGFDNKEVEEAILSFDKGFSEFEITVLLNGEYDDTNAILELHPGAGGTESMDWCLMLYRMYTRYAQRRNFKIEVLDYLPGEEAGIKSVTILIKGHNAYGYLKSERGVHRLVRISPFDTNARRHTSFVSCDVAPELKDQLSVNINDDDLKIDVYRSSGAGGQSVNTTDSAVRITHKPTGIVVTCQNERSQIQNREQAMVILRSKLLQIEMQKKESELRELRGEQKEIGFGSQIRSYVFHPYSLVKDHRTNWETGNINAVMDGSIDDFINQYLKMQVKI